MNAALYSAALFFGFQRGQHYRNRPRSDYRLQLFSVWRDSLMFRCFVSGCSRLAFSIVERTARPARSRAGKGFSNHHPLDVHGQAPTHGSSQSLPADPFARVLPTPRLRTVPPYGPFHTEGFSKQESSPFHQLVPEQNNGKPAAK
jgi:hypothetical protein